MASTERPALATGLGLLHEAVSNTSSYLAPPMPKDLALALPRLLSRLTTMITDGSGAAKASGYNSTGNGTAAGLMGAAGHAFGSGGTAGFFAAFGQQVRTFGGIFSYMTSKWALGCFAAAILLNRTTIYAASRRNLQLGWRLRLALRLVPLLVLLALTGSVLRALRCQTSPGYSLIRTGEPGGAGLLDFAEDGGFLYWLSSAALFWESEPASCHAVGMIPEAADDPAPLRGSMALMWTCFMAFNFSQFVETLSCAVQGRPVATETGMTLFEHSLAFAEAEAIVSSHVALLASKTAAAGDGGEAAGGPGQAQIMVSYFARSPMGLAQYNTSPEILLMALISCLNNITSQTLGILGWQARYRLVNTGIWGLCFMASFIWGFLSFSADKGVEASILRFPTVCVVGFIPHTLILVGILLCGCIYGLAILLSVLSPPEGTPAALSLRERIRHAHDNMQANSQLAGIRLHMHEDFYTALLRVGFSALNAASDAVFLNEGRRINVGHWTWLEEERMADILQARSGADHQGNVAEGVTVAPADGGHASKGAMGRPSGWQSGYARERNTKVLRGRPSAVAARAHDGVGAMQRGGRYILALGFLAKIARLAAGWAALTVLRLMDHLGIHYRPAWLRRLWSNPKAGRESRVTVQRQGGTAATGKEQEQDEPGLQFWGLSEDGELVMPDENTDVETHTRRRIQQAHDAWGPDQEAELDADLYRWWKVGGWWGERDSSDDYRQPSIPPDCDADDTTSVLSFSTTSTTDDDLDDSETSGRRTPTQRDFPSSASFSRNTTPSEDLPLDATSLARLLAPRDAESRRDARRLAAHLTSPYPLTRSQYRQAAAAQDAHVLTSSRIFRPSGASSSSAEAGGGAPSGDLRLSLAEEADVLEQLIVRFRARGGSGRKTAAAAPRPWSEGAGGMGAGGPVCVVCQSEPRTVLAWPCRCLSLCEDCRVSLAMNNFGSCVCCRQEVVGFSRLYVP